MQSGVEAKTIHYSIFLEINLCQSAIFRFRYFGGPDRPDLCFIDLGLVGEADHKQVNI